MYRVPATNSLPVLRFIFYLLLLLLLPDFVIWFNHTRQSEGVWRTVSLVAPTVLAIVCMIMILCQVRVMWLMQFTFLLLICVAVPKLVFVTVAGLGKLVAWNQPAVQGIFCRAGIVLAIAAALVQMYGAAFGWRRLQVDKPDIKVAGVPANFKGYRVVQVSDLHVGTYGTDMRYVQRLVDSVNLCQPDLIVFTGDLINTDPEEIIPFVRTLSKLRATDGVLSVLGNHDYCIYSNTKPAAERAMAVKRVVELQKRMGWRVLLNENERIARGGDTLYVAGVENIGKPPFPAVGNLQKAVQGAPDDACIILLSHDPWHWKHGVVGDKRIALTLSGHTHALQMQVGRFSPAQWIIPEWGGLYRQGNQQLYVSTGVGGSVPYRLGAWPKVELIVL